MNGEKLPILLVNVTLVVRIYMLSLCTHKICERLNALDFALYDDRYQMFVSRAMSVLLTRKHTYVI